jgi:4-hydroxybutyrate CoA-transferase
MDERLEREFIEKTMSAEEAVRLIKNDDIIYIGTCSSVAYGLLEALWARRDELLNVTLSGALIAAPADAILSDRFNYISYFFGIQERKRQNTARIDFASVHLSQTDIWCKETAKPNIAFFEVSPPDENGYMCYGAGGVGIGSHVKDVVDVIILQINKREPYVYGEKNLVHISEATSVVYCDYNLPEPQELPKDEAIDAIADLLLEHITDGACIQLGLGGLATAVGYRLREKNDLGAHSELVSDSIMDLMKLGVLNNKRKSFFPGKTVTGFSLGSKSLYDFLNRNEDFYFMPFTEVNDPVNIARNDNMISINTAISIDLFGQINAESIAGRQYSGTGGQLDFVKGAQMSKGGKSFIAVQSVVNNSKTGISSRIVSQFPAGTIVTTPRSEVQYVVTEYGCVNLKQLCMRDRVIAMISLAHPDFRPQLTDEAKRAGML